MMQSIMTTVTTSGRTGEHEELQPPPYQEVSTSLPSQPPAYEDIFPGPPPLSDKAIALGRILRQVLSGDYYINSWSGSAIIISQMAVFRTPMNRLCELKNISSLASGMTLGLQDPKLATSEAQLIASLENEVSQPAHELCLSLHIVMQILFRYLKYQSAGGSYRGCHEQMDNLELEEKSKIDLVLVWSVATRLWEADRELHEQVKSRMDRMKVRGCMKVICSCGSHPRTPVGYQSPSHWTDHVMLGL